MQSYEKMRAESRRILSYNMRHFGTLEGWLRELNLDYAPIEVKEVRQIACYNAVRFDVVCHGVTLASFMKMKSGYSNYPYILTHLNKAVPQFERDLNTGKIRKVGVCTSQILDFYWGGGIGKILSDRPTVKDLASLVACKLREKENQFTTKEWDWIKAAHRNPKYALRMISSFMKA